MITKERNEIKIGFFLSYASMGISVILGIMFTPYILKMLGQSEYGLYSLIGAFIGYISLFDLGVGATVLRFASRYRVEGNNKKLESFIATVFVIYAIIGVVVLVLGFIIYMNLDKIFSSSLDEFQVDKARLMFGILIVSLAVSFIGHLYPAVIKAYEKFVFVKGIEICKHLIRTLAVFVLLYVGYDSLAIVIVDALLNIMISIIQFIYVQFYLRLGTLPLRFKKDIVKDVYGFSLYVFLSTLINQVNFRVGVVILGIYSDTIEIAVLALGVSLITYYIQFSDAFAGMFMHKLTLLTNKDFGIGGAEDLIIKVSRFQVKLLSLIIVGFMTVGKQFIVLWVGYEYQKTYYVVILIMLAYFLPYTQTTLNTLSQVMNKHKLRNCLYGATALANIIVMINLVEYSGAIGVAISTCVTMVIGYGVFIQLYYQRGMGVNMIRFLREVYLDTIPAVLIATLIGLLLNNVLFGSWVYIFIDILLITIVYFIGIWVFGANRYERGQIKGMILKLLKIVHM